MVYTPGFMTMVPGPNSAPQLGHLGDALRYSLPAILPMARLNL